MSGAAAGRTHSLLKRGWNQIPDIVAGSVLACIGISLSALGVTMYYANDGDNKRYKHGYVVMRPEDPRAAKVRKD